MPQLTDKDRIRSLLNIDRIWSAYALGDLEPAFFQDSKWYADAGAIVLLYCRFDDPVLIAVGEAAGVEPLLDEILAHENPRGLHLSVRPDVLPLIARRYQIDWQKLMHRMVLRPERFQKVPTSAVPLTRADLPALRRLHDDGNDTGETPHFFLPEMLDQGTYVGIWKGQDLIASAGTHLLSRTEGMGAVGNIYTRRDRRGLGLGAQVTSAVAAHLLELNLATIVLNVHEGNEAARRLYRRLGFEHHCDFYEGYAARGLANLPTFTPR